MSSGRGPQLQPWQMANRTVYVVDADTRDFPGGLVNANIDELSVWRLRDELSPTALAIVAFLSQFRGMRGGRDGCGVQLSLAEWSRVLGRSRRMVQYAFAQLVARGFVSWRRRYVAVDWIDAGGKPRTEADIYYAAYLTFYGARRIERRGEFRRLKVIAGQGRVLILKVAGVVGDLSEAFREKLKAIALRVTDAVARCTPTDRSKPLGREQRSDWGKRNCGKAPGPAPPGPDPNAKASGSAWKASHAAGAADWNAELERCWRERLFTPATAYGALWATADAKMRAFLTAQFASIRRTLGRSLAERGPADGRGRESSP